MAAIRTLRVLPDSELGQALHDAAASGEVVLIDTGDAVYRVGVESARAAVAAPRPPSGEALERSRAGIREAAGSWREIDTDAVKAYLRARRRTANRPSVEL